MYEIVKVLDGKRVTPTAALTLTLARCCHCGRMRTIAKQHVVRANRLGRKHCPDCLKDTFHYLTNTRIWRIWKGMLGRATDPENPDFVRYGASGRGVCEEWLVFANFYRDMSPGYAEHLTIERVDNSEGYSKGNCRWATNMEQQANKNNNRVLRYQGRDMHLAEFCRVAGVTRGAISPRLNAGMSPEQALADYAMSRYPRYRAPR